MLVNYDVEERRMAKMKSDDRILVLGRIEGKRPVSSSGSFDPRLFTGENNLHAIYDVMSNTWSMKYDNGALPGGLQQKFTLFSELLKHAKNYFRNRNVDIVEVRE